MSDDSLQEIDVSNPVLGRLAAKGVRVSDLIGLLTFCGVVGLAAVGWKMSEAIGAQRVESVKENTEQRREIAETNRALLGAIRNLATAQRLTSCIISVPQEKRERQFTEANSLCRRMSAPD